VKRSNTGTSQPWSGRYTSKNSGSTATPVLADIQALDTGFQRQDGREFVLHNLGGAEFSPYKLSTHRDGAGSEHRSALRTLWRAFEARGKSMPYYNLEGFNDGIIIVIGWPGTMVCPV